MYTLVAVLSLVATAAFVRRRPVVFVVALTLLLYTHTWGVFLFAAFALVWLVRDRGRGGLLVGAAVAVLYLPWVPSLVFQALHTGAPWSLRPSVLYLVPAALAVAWRPRDELVLVGAAGLALAWLASQLEPAWSPRYLFVLFGPVLVVLGAAAGVGRRRPAIVADAARRSARRQEQRPRGRRQRRRHAARGRPRRLHAARAGPGPAPVPPAGVALPDAARHARGPFLHRLARRPPAPARRARRSGSWCRVCATLAPGRRVVLVVPVGAPRALAVEPRGPAPDARMARGAARRPAAALARRARRGRTRRASAARCEPRSSRSYADRGERGPPHRRRTAHRRASRGPAQRGPSDLRARQRSRSARSRTT